MSAEPATDPVELGAQADPPALMRVASVAPPPVALAGFAHVTEREPGPWICCAFCSGAMVAAYAGRCSATLLAAHTIRAAVPLKHAGGATPRQLRAGVLEATGLSLLAVPTDGGAIDERLAAGWAIAVALRYGDLPKALRRWSPAFTGGHMAVLAGIDAGRWGWYDPLATAGWRGEYVDPGVILPALWSTGAQGAPGKDAAPMPTTYALKIERWTRDGGKVTTLGTPLGTDGEPDWSKRLAFLSGRGGADPRLELIDRGTLTAANDPAMGNALEAALAAYALPVVAGEVPASELILARHEGELREYARWVESLGIPDPPA